MKKLLTLLFVSMMFIGLAGCGQGKKDEPVTPTGEIKTMGDLFRVGYIGFEYDIESFVIETEDTVYELTMTPELHEKLEAVDFFAEDRDEQFEEILKDVEVFLVEDLAIYIPTDADLKSLVGKTGQELLDEDFYECGYNFWDEQYFYMTQGMIEYKIYFNENVTLKDDEDIDVEETIKDMTVKKAEFFGFSGGTTDVETLPQN